MPPLVKSITKVLVRVVVIERTSVVEIAPINPVNFRHVRQKGCEQRVMPSCVKKKFGTKVSPKTWSFIKSFIKAFTAVASLLIHTAGSTMAYSSDDLHWLCNWGSVPLLPWETMGLHYSEPCVVSHFEQWMLKETMHINVSENHRKRMLPLTEHELMLLHMQATDMRFGLYLR